MRARAPEAKEARRQAFIGAARSLLDGGLPLAAIPMSAVAEAAGLAKGTSYLYFPSKEALFLEVLLEELDAWFAELGVAMGPDLGALSRTLADTLVARPRLLQLLAELHPTLEAGIDGETARAFKLRLGDQMLAADAAAVARVPELVPGAFARLLMLTHALVVGLGPMSRPAPAVAAALAEPSLRWMQVDLRRELERAVAAWIRGGLLDS